MRLVTEHPLAADSLDHRRPRGTMNDDTHCIEFVKNCEELFSYKRHLAYLDLGCSGGGMVLDFFQNGHEAFGIEGSDYSQQRGRASWGLIPDLLATADITKPFDMLTDDGQPQRFDVISAWEVLEHLPTQDLPQFWLNVQNHLLTDGIFIASVSNVDDVDGNESYHPTIQPREWWFDRINAAGLTPITVPFGPPYPRGPDSRHRDPGFYLAVRRVV